MQRHAPAQHLVGLGQHVGSTAHPLDAAGDHRVGVAGGDRTAGLDQRLGAGRAEPVHGDAGNGDGEPRQQRGHPGDVAVLLAGTVGVAEVDVVDLGRVEPGVPLDQLGDGQRGEVVGAHVREAAAVASERCADGVQEEHALELAHMP